MKSAVIVFPGSNRDHDAIVALQEVTGSRPAGVWYTETALPPADLIVAGDPCAALLMLGECLADRAKKSANGAQEGRRKAIATVREEIAAKRRKLIETVKGLMN